MNQEELSEVRRDLKYNIKFWVIERFEDDVESYFIELLDHIDSQAEQIKRLEAERAVWIKHYQDNRKKHAALKKLGEMVRARGRGPGGRAGQANLSSAERGQGRPLATI